MRILLATLAVLIAGSTIDAVQADPYRWCAQYSGRNGGSQNCGFVTEEQCRATVSGVGGICLPNPFFDGRPVVTPEDRPTTRRRQH